MRNTLTLVALAAALAGCVTTSSGAGIKSIGSDTFMVSEMSGFGNVVERAAVFCASFGQTVQVTSNTSQMGLASGDQYAVITFRCVSPDAPN